MTDIYEYINEIKKPDKAVSGEEYCFAAVGLDHGHIGGMVSGLIEAGARLLYVYDKDRTKAESMAGKHRAKTAASLDEIFSDKRVKMIASAAVPCERGPLGCEVMRHGLDFFVDKAPFTSLAQLEEAKITAAETGRRYFVYFSERLHSECSILAGYLIQAGFIGRVFNIVGKGPHSINIDSRPSWFFEREKYGGILTDIGSHQAEQFMFYAGCDDVKVISSTIGNFAFHDYPQLDDYGDMHLTSSKGVAGYHAVHWFSPNGLKSWGDGRCFVEGERGYIEMRKNVDIDRSGGNVLYLVNNDGTFRIEAGGKTGFPFFRDMILDSLEGTERAMTQEHIWKAAEVSLLAQKNALELTPDVDGRR